MIRGKNKILDRSIEEKPDLYQTKTVVIACNH